MSWTAKDLSDQTGKTFVITGANSGLGLESVRLLAPKGATIVLACRTLAKGHEAAAPIRARAPGATLDVMALDLSSLESIAMFSRVLADRHPRVDVLLNNAGIMAVPFTQTADGFEMQLGTNHLGHHALTAQLLPLLENAPAARVVTVSSLAHGTGTMNFDDLMSEKSYSKWPAYSQSKLANLLFAYELERWLRRHGKKTISVAAHPGYSATNLQVGPQFKKNLVEGAILKLANVVIAQRAEMGALPHVYAATHADVKGGQYIGPDGLFGARGLPRVVTSNAESYNEAVAATLWHRSAELTRVGFEP